MRRQEAAKRARGARDAGGRKGATGRKAGAGRDAAAGARGEERKNGAPREDAKKNGVHKNGVHAHKNGVHKEASPKDDAKKNGAGPAHAAAGQAPPAGAREPDMGPPVAPSRAPAVDQPLPSISGKDATRVVRDAAKILEQELAAGILAAKRVEERFIDVKQIRDRNPDEVMQRFRRDAHEALDIIFDVITVAVDQASTLTEKSFALSGRRTVQPGAAGAQRKLQQALPTLSPPQPLLPGQTAELFISVENDSDKPTQPIQFASSDLVSGDRSIPGSHVKCVPNQVVLGPRASERIAMQIHVPVGTAPGTYAGMFQANNLAAVRAVLVVEVRAAAG